VELDLALLIKLSLGFCGFLQLFVFSLVGPDFIFHHCVLLDQLLVVRFVSRARIVFEHSPLFLQSLNLLPRAIAVHPHSLCHVNAVRDFTRQIRDFIRFLFQDCAMFLSQTFDHSIMALSALNTFSS